MLKRHKLLSKSQAYTKSDGEGYRKKEYRIVDGEQVRVDKATSKYCRRRYECECRECGFIRPVPMHPNQATKDVEIRVLCANCDDVTVSTRAMANVGGNDE